MSREYQAYLVRLERPHPRTDWRVYVENAETGEVTRFGSDWELLHFLLKILLPFPNGRNESPASAAAEKPNDRQMSGGHLL